MRHCDPERDLPDDDVHELPDRKDRDRREKQQAAERQERPVEGDALQDRAAPAHAPYVIEDILYGLEEEEHDEDQRDGAEDADRARAGALDEPVYQRDKLRVHREIAAALHAVVLVELWRDEADQALEEVHSQMGVALAEYGRRDQHGDRG